MAMKKPMEKRDGAFKATKEFTDRIDARKAFYEAYQYISNNVDDFKVLSYYGIAGIGKTGLLTELCKWMDEKNLQTGTHRYIRYNFDTDGTDKNLFLCILKKLIVEKYGDSFKFPLFEKAVTRWNEHRMMKIESVARVNDIFSGTEKKEAAVEVLSTIPGVSDLVQVAKAVDKVTTIGANYFYERKIKEKYEVEIKELESMQADDLEKKLYRYFILDMQENMIQDTTPLVIFLDTYEKYINTFDDEYSVINDEWFRCGEESVVQSIPGILWVIGGREKLVWGDEMGIDGDPEWDEIHLEEHLLGKLEDRDSDSFLKKAGIYEDDIRAHIVKEGSGVPVFLDMCVNQYERIKRADRIPKVEDFGRTTKELVERYLRYMDQATRDLAYLLACAKQWTDEEIFMLVKENPWLVSFSLRGYKEFVSHSFIEKEGKWYCMSDLIQRVISEDAERSFRNEVNVQMIKCRMMQMEKLSSYDQIIFQIEKIIAAFEYIDDVELVEEPFVDVHYLIDSLEKWGDYKNEYTHAQKVMEHCAMVFTGSIYDVKARALLTSALIKSGKYENARDVAKESLQIMDSLEEEENVGFEKIRITLETGYAIALLETGEYSEAKTVIEKTYEKEAALLGEDVTDGVVSLGILAGAYRGLGDYQKSKELNEEVYAKRVEVLGDKHPDTLASMNNLAVAYSNIGDYEKCKELHEEVYTKRTEALGDKHPDTLRSMNNLALAYSRIGDYKKSRELHEEVYAKRVEVLGDKHPDTLNSMNNLALAYEDLGDYSKSTELYEEVYVKRVEVLGENHPDTLGSMNNLALAYEDLGDYSKSTELYEEVYAKRVEVLGKNHPNTLSSMNNLALAYEDLGDYQKSRELHEEVYAKRVEVLGKNHPNTLSSMNNLASAYSNLGDYQKSRELHEEVYTKRVEVLGKNHPNTISSQYSLKDVYRKLAEYEKQKEVLEDLYNKQLAALGEDSRETLSLLNLLAEAHVLTEEYEKAKILFEKAYSKNVDILGNRHKLSVVSLYYLAKVHFKLMDYEASIKIYEEAYSQGKEVFGEDSPFMRETIEDLALGYEKIGDAVKAKEYQKLLDEKNV